MIIKLNSLFIDSSFHFRDEIMITKFVNHEKTKQIMN